MKMIFNNRSIQKMENRSKFKKKENKVKQIVLLDKNQAICF